MPADIVIYAVVAAGLVFWLRNLLGSRSGDERQRPNPFAHRPDPAAPRGNHGQAQNAEAAARAAGLLPEAPADLRAGLDRNMEIAPAAEQGMAGIIEADRDFVPPEFLRAAQDAYAIIIEAFAKGDKETLRDLLAPAVYQAFDKVIDQRAAAGEKSSVEIHAVRRVAITAAAIRDKTAYITVKFTADETSVLRGRDDRIISGNPDRVTEAIDIWTFGRPLRSRDPAWLLYETREDAADEVPGSTVISAA